jgi:predicted ATPase
MKSHLRQAPRPPRPLNPHISASLEHLILKLLAQNPNDRYASAQQVRRILSNLLLDTEHATRPRIRLLVGREKQAQALRACWNEAQAERGQLAFITGEAGIGKTRLAQQVAAQSHPPVLLIGRCQETTGRPAYELFTEVLRAYLATIPPEFFKAEARQLLSNFTPLIPEIPQMLPDLHIPPPLEPKQEQLRLMTSLMQFIRHATVERPWFLILEDLQWADRSSLELLLYLGRHLPSMPIFIIGTYRDTEVGRGHPLLETLRGLRSHPTYRHFHLERLTQEEVGHVLTYIWQRSVPDALTERIFQHTAGNPFYVEEVAKSLEDVGLIPLSTDHESELTWHFRALEEVQLPQSVRETVWQRIDHLSAETQALLRQAAILGQTFRFDDLQRMSGMSEWDVLEHLDEALERHMVEEVPSGNGLRFRQTEIQVVIYDDLGPLRRRLLHRKAGEALEQRAGPQGALFAEDMAHHFSKAGETEKAVKYSMLAAHQAQLAYANETALQWYGRVLSMVYASSVDDPALQRVRLLAHKASGEVLTLVSRYDEALEQYSAAQVLAENENTSPDERRRQMTGLCYQIANIYELRDEYDAVFAWLTEGLHYIEDDQPIVEAAQIYLLGAKVHHRQGESAQALGWCQKSLSIASQIKTHEGLQAKGAALYTQAGIDMRLGNLDSAIRLCHESIQAYHRTNDMVGESNAYINLASAYVAQGNWDQADEAYQKGWRIKQEIGEVYGQAIIIHNLAELHFKRGDFEQALSLYEQCLATWQQITATRGEAATLISLAQVYIQQHDWEKVRQFLSRAQTLLDEIGSKEYLPELERVWGEFYLYTEMLDQALQHIQYAVELANVYDDPREGGIAYRVLGQTYLASGDHQLAKAALHHSLRILGGLHNEYEVAKTKTVLAHLAMSNDDTTPFKAQSYLKQAIETFEKLRAQADLAQARALEQQILLE